MAEGQVMELLETDNWNLGRDRYLEIITAKTAELFVSACSSGAIISRADDQQIKTLGQFGFNLGITFQQIQKYEKGTNRIGASRLQHIARVLSTPVSFFFDDAPGMTPGPANAVVADVA